MLLLFSVALVVDNPEMFNRVANTFYSRTSMRFIILLWGEKAELVGQENKHVPVFTFMEVIDLGRQSRRALSNAHDAGTSPRFLGLYLTLTINIKYVFSYKYNKILVSIS